jgi:antitoxin ParD1/3/4
MDLTLTPELQRYVEQKVKSGQYATPQDVVHAALAALMQQDDLASMPVEELETLYPGFRQKIAEGLADIEAGRLSDGEEFFDQLEREERESFDKAGRKTA